MKGTLSDAKGGRVDGETVVIWSENSFEQTRSAKGGAFEFHNLAPGDYFVAAADDDSDLLLDSEFRTKIEGQTKKISLQENSRETIEVKLIEKSALEAALAQ